MLLLVGIAVFVVGGLSGLLLAALLGYAGPGERARGSTADEFSYE